MLTKIKMHITMFCVLFLINMVPVVGFEPTISQLFEVNVRLELTPLSQVYYVILVHQVGGTDHSCCTGIKRGNQLRFPFNLLCTMSFTLIAENQIVNIKHILITPFLLWSHNNISFTFEICLKIKI